MAKKEVKLCTPKVLQCVCEHEFQDRKYGKGFRLFNRALKEANKYRCTVCGKEKTSG